MPRRPRHRKLIPIIYRSTDADEAATTLKRHAADYRRGCDGGHGAFPGYYLINYQIPAELEDALLPHWCDFIGAIQSSDPDNQFWTLHGATLPQKMLDALQATVITRNIHTLKIRSVRNSSSDDNYYKKIDSLVCEVLHKNTNIKRLVLGGASMVGSKFRQALRENASLEELHLTRMSLRDNAGLLARTLYAARSLKHISLRHSVIGERGGEVLAKFLRGSYPVSSLDLGNVDISDADVEKIAVALKRNTNLRMLTLVGRRNAISELGRKALCTALFCSDDMQRIARSNHACFVQTVYDSVEPSPEECLLDVLNRDTCPKDNRRWKILSYLYATNGWGSELVDSIGTPTGVNEFRYYQRRKLIPEILAFVSHNVSEAPPEESSELPSETPGDADNQQSVGGMRALASNSLARSWQKPVESDSHNSDGSDTSSVESDASFDGYDSELEDLDEAFEEDETDEVYDEFHNSFSDASFSGKRLRLTVLYQVLQLWGLPLMDKSPPLSETGSKRRQQSPESKPKKMRREIDSLAD